MTPDETAIATFGLCAQCGAPRWKKVITETDPDGKTTTSTVQMLCTLDSTHQQYPSQEEPWLP